jgi:hypothetical protein
MISAGIEPREMTFSGLIDHLVNLESTVSAAQTEERPAKKQKSNENHHKSDKNKKSRGEERKSSTPKGNKCCVLCKALKGENSTAWKTHNTDECKSKDYYAKKISGNMSNYTSNYTSNYKGKNDGKSYSRNKEQAKTQKQSMRREIKRALKRCEAGYSSSDSDGSKSE